MVLLIAALIGCLVCCLRINRTLRRLPVRLSRLLAESREEKRR